MFFWVGISCILLFFSCKVLKKQKFQESGYGGVWKSENSIAKIQSLSNKKDTVSAQLSTTDPVEKSERKPAFLLNKNPRVILESVPENQQKIGNKQESEDELYEEAKTSLFLTMIAGVLYFINFMLLDPATFTVMIWMSVFNNIWLTILAVITVLLLFGAFLTSKDVLRKMSKSGIKKGRQFAVISLISSVALMISMAPVVIYVLLLLLWLLIQS